MLSLLDVIGRTTSYFEKNGVPEPRLQAEWILAHVIGCGRLDLYLRFDRPMEETLLAELRPLVKRRAQREPLQYILGTTPFGELKLKCDARALVPRPETEGLVEEIQKRRPEKDARVLDLGTGTGAIALSLAKAWPEALVTAIDVSDDALTLARQNAEANGLMGRVNFLQSDWFGQVTGEFDLIVSNPPYLTDEEWESAAPEVKDHEPFQALVAPNAGLADLETILREGRKHLAANGMMAFETGIAHHEALAAIARDAGYAKSEGAPDLFQRPRYFFAWK